MNEYDDLKVIEFDNKNKFSKQNRFTSKVVWLSVISMILLILDRFGVYEKIGITQDSIRIIIDGVLCILVLFGVLNDPNNAEGF